MTPASSGVGPSSSSQSTTVFDREIATWPPVPDERAGSEFTVGDGTVTDTLTGLVWQRDVPGVFVRHGEAVAACDALELGGHSDWVLPTLAELVSLLDFGTWDPAIEPSAFPGAPSASYWTATPGDTAGRVWQVGFRTGSTSQDNVDWIGYTRCVRLRQDAAVPVPRYQVGSATVLDTLTGLEWQRTPPAGFSNMKTWVDAFNDCGSLQLDGGGWSLPGVQELHSIVDVRLTPLRIDTSVFSGAESGSHWTDATYAADSDFAVALSELGIGSSFRDGTRRYRCVR